MFRYTVFQKSPWEHHVLAVGGWWLAVGDWRLVAVGGGWWWLAAVGGWGLVVDGSWQWLAVGGWSLLAVVPFIVPLIFRYDNAIHRRYECYGLATVH